MKRFVFGLLMALLCVVLPLTAQDSAVDTVNFNGVQFEYPRDFATGLQIRHAVPIEELDPPPPPDVEPPSYVHPPHTEFFFTIPTSHPQNAFGLVDRIRVYRIADFADYHEFYMDELSALQKLLDEQPDLTTQRPLPYLGLAAPAIISKQAYVETETLRGVRYMSEFLPLAVMSVGPDSIIYTFQALSKDGQYYVTADFQLTLPSIPIPTSNNPDELTEEYYATIQALVDAAQPADFTPNLAVIEAIFASIEVGE